MRNNALSPSKRNHHFWRGADLGMKATPQVDAEGGVGEGLNYGKEEQP